MSTRWILALVLGVGLLCGALRSPTPEWSLAISEATLAVLLFSSFMAWWGSGRVRSFCVGFTVLGWARLLIGHAPWLAPTFDAPLRQILESIGGWAYPNDLAPEFTEVGPRATNLVHIGRSLLVLVYAVAGGATCLYLPRRASADLDASHHDGSRRPTRTHRDVESVEDPDIGCPIVRKRTRDLFCECPRRRLGQATSPVVAAPHSSPGRRV